MYKQLFTVAYLQVGYSFQFYHAMKLLSRDARSMNTKRDVFCGELHQCCSWKFSMSVSFYNGLLRNMVGCGYEFDNKERPKYSEVSCSCQVMPLKNDLNISQLHLIQYGIITWSFGRGAKSDTYPKTVRCLESTAVKLCDCNPLEFFSPV